MMCFLIVVFMLNIRWDGLYCEIIREDPISEEDVECMKIAKVS